MKKIKKCINGTYVQQNDNTNIYLRNNVRKIENPNFDYRTWLELTDEEKQSIIENTASDITNMLSEEGKAALKWNKTKGRGYDMFDIRTSKDILNTRKENELNNIKKWFKENTGDNFKCGGMKRVPRKKAFWGALIGAALSAIGGIGSSIINSNKQQEIAMQNYKQQKELMDKMDAQNKQAAENEYYNKINSNINIYDDFKKSLLSAKMGGKFKKCRKKAEWGTDDTENLISSIFGIGSNIATTAIDANTQLKTNELALAAAGRIGKQYNYVTPNFNSIRETINERNSDINEMQKRRRGQLNSLYLS